MSLRFELQEQVNPRDPTLPNQFFAKIIRGDTIEYDDLLRLISKMSSINYGTIQGVLGTLIDVLEEQLRFGRTVRIGDFGTFYMTLKSQSALSVQDFEIGNIRGAKIHFRPGIKLLRILETLTFTRLNGQHDQNGQPHDTKKGKSAPVDRDVEIKKKDA